MSKVSLLSLLGMIVIAIAIGVLYIQPTITEIRQIEVTTMDYRRELQNVSGVNATLANKLTALENVSTSDKQALERYLPNAVDEVAVMKDITVIFASAGAAVDSITYNLPTVNGVPEVTATADKYKGLEKHDFLVSATVDSSQLLRIMSALENNNYLLQVSNLKITPSETADTLQAVVVLTVFSRAEVIPVTPNVM